MSVKQFRYKNLSRSSMYRHRVERKRRRLNNETSDESDDSLPHEVIDNETEGNNYQSDDENAENPFRAREVPENMNFYRNYDNMNDDDNSSQYSDARSTQSYLDDIGNDFISEDEDGPDDITDDDDNELSSENDDDENISLHEPLYPGARITIGESLTCTLKLHLRHKQSDSHLSDLLKYVEMHCPEGNKCPKTLHFFRKFLGNFKTPIEKHFYCPHCSMELENLDDICPVCPEPKATSYFISIPLESQLQELFKRPGFYNSLRYRFDRRKEDDCNLEDIFDGEVYRSFCTDESPVNLRSQSNLSFTWNSDGVALYQSSKFSIWPEFLMINELPPEDRKKPNNMLMTGLSFGTKKPVGNQFLAPLAENLKKLKTGVSLYVEDLDHEVNIKGITLCCTCDLPAKALFLNMKQYNATYGCHKCKIETQTVEGKRSYQKTENLEARMTDETEKFAELAVKLGAPIFGVKGPTLMSLILPDFIRCSVIDSMHLLTGITKLLFRVWFLPEYKNHPASISNHFNRVRDRICSIAPPSFVERLPRKIDDFAYWKASELIIWLLMYSTVVLSDIMSEQFLSHHNLLVCGIYLLYQKSVPMDDIDKAQLLLHKYVKQLGALYGMEFMSCNIHLLLHLPKVVHDFGPLWVYTCFPFENANGILKLLVHATRDAQIQICKGVSLYLSLEGLKKKYIRDGSESATFYNYIDKKGTLRCKLKYIYRSIAIVGVIKKFITVPPEIRQNLLRFGYNQHSVYNFHCLVKNGLFYSSQSYRRKTKTNSNCVIYISNNQESIGFIKTFLRVSNCTCKNSVCDHCIDESETLAIIEKYNGRKIFSTSTPQTRLRFIQELEIDSKEKLIIINVSQLKAVYLQIMIKETAKIYTIKPLSL